ncbi:MAG TPA: ATP synthase F1 subunit epsilon [Phaeodactylibacter sp.]|nr:ATP synthase F1 subunit epsilon [Phaeodactylibacter sp.]
MNIVVLTPDKEVFNGEINSVKVPGVDGQFQILRGHAPLVSALSAGNVSIESKDGKKITFDIHQGFVEVLRDEISLLVTGVAD